MLASVSSTVISCRGRMTSRTDAASQIQGVEHNAAARGESAGQLLRADQ